MNSNIPDREEAIPMIPYRTPFETVATRTDGTYQTLIRIMRIMENLNIDPFMP